MTWHRWWCVGEFVSLSRQSPSLFMAAVRESRRPRCGHVCQLESTPCCCWCSDKRTPGTSQRYQDGVGMVAAPREIYYCSTCKERGSPGPCLPQPPTRSRFVSPSVTAMGFLIDTARCAISALRENRREATLLHGPSRPAARLHRSRPRSTRGPHPTIMECGHLCQLNTTNMCCGCLDTRPWSEDGLYDAYIDGRGMQRVVPRHHHYCPVCKNRGSPDPPPPPSPPPPSSPSPSPPPSSSSSPPPSSSSTSSPSSQSPTPEIDENNEWVTVDCPPPQEVAAEYWRNRHGEEAMRWPPVCVVCLDAPARIANIHCGHLCLCTVCSKRFAKGNGICPVCRAPWTSLPIFIP